MPSPNLGSLSDDPAATMAYIIQMALTPIFLLKGIGRLLAFLTNNLLAWYAFRQNGSVPLSTKASGAGG